MTPLHVAAERGFVKIVDYLVSRGADIDIKDKKGVTVCSTNKIHIFEFELAHTFNYQFNFSSFCRNPSIQ